MVALESLVGSNRTKVPAKAVVEVDGITLIVRIDQARTPVEPPGDEQPNIALRAEPLVMLGLATGMVTVQQAIAAGNLSGNQQDIEAAYAFIDATSPANC